MLWKCHAQSRLLGISAHRCVLRSGITGQELILASCSEKLLPLSCSTWCCFTRCRLVRHQGLRLCCAKTRTSQRCNIVPHKCLQLFVASRINAASERCVHVSSGFAIQQTFVERGVYFLARDGRCGSATHARRGQKVCKGASNLCGSM